MKRRPFAPPPVEVAYSTTPSVHYYGPLDRRAVDLACQPPRSRNCLACRVGLAITIFCYALLMWLLLWVKPAHACGDLPPPDFPAGLIQPVAL